MNSGFNKKTILKGYQGERHALLVLDLKIAVSFWFFKKKIQIFRKTLPPLSAPVSCLLPASTRHAISERSSVLSTYKTKSRQSHHRQVQRKLSLLVVLAKIWESVSYKNSKRKRLKYISPKQNFPVTTFVNVLLFFPLPILTQAGFICTVSQSRQGHTCAHTHVNTQRRHAWKLSEGPFWSRPCAASLPKCVWLRAGEH